MFAGQAIAVKVSGDPTSSNNGIFYFHNDHLGSTSVLTKDSDGYVLGSSVVRYYPFGGYRDAGAQDLTDRGYTGHKENLDIGLIYMNARFYVPSVGKFASADTIVPDPANPQSFNKYSYVENNPLIYTDPSGHALCKKAEDGELTGICNNWLDFEAFPIGIGNETFDKIGTVILNIGCGLLGGACVAEDGMMRPATDDEFMMNIPAAVIGTVNPIGSATSLARVGLADSSAGTLIREIVDASTHGSGNRVVIGRWAQNGGYIQEALSNGGVYFDTGDDVWNALGTGLYAQDELAWAVNEQFLQDQLQSGRVIELFGETVDEVLINRPNSFTAREINFLFQEASNYGYIFDNALNVWLPSP